MINQPFDMADGNDANPAANQQGELQGVGERMSSLEAQLSQLVTLVSNQQQLLASVVEIRERERVESSSSDRVAPRDMGLEAGAHQSGAAGGAAGSTGGDAQGFGESSTRVGSSSLLDSGLNPRVASADRSVVSAVNFGSIHGTVGGVALNNQSAVPPTTNSASEWWGRVASGNTLIPGAHISNSVERWGSF